MAPNGAAGDQPAGSPSGGASPATKPTVHLNIIPVRGDITKIDTPVAIGARYDGLPISGPTREFDRLLVSWLTRAVDMGMIGSGLGQIFPINLEARKEAGTMKTGYLLLLGLGEPGRFAQDDLRFVFSNAVVAVKGLRSDRVATGLLGTRRKELTIEDAAHGLVYGVLDGYARFRSIIDSIHDKREELTKAAQQPLNITLVEPNEDTLN